MWTGVSALKNIDQALQTLRNDVVRLDAELSGLTVRLGEAGRHRLAIFQQIAQVRLNELEQGSISSHLQSADRQALQFLQDRESAMNAIEAQIEDCNTRIAELETKREQRLGDSNTHVEAIAELEADVQSRLQNDKGYLNAFAVAQKADSVSIEAKQKADTSQKDMQEKAAPYQADKLFMYLWERGYATADYKSGLLFRWLDGWVARLIDYANLRLNYWNLTEIPKRLAAHAQMVAQQAEQARQAIEKLEQSALDNEEMRSAKQHYATALNQLDQLDDDIDALEANLNTLLEERQQFISGKDQYLDSCLRILSDAIQHQSLSNVQVYVKETRSPTDDQLVIELQQLEDRFEDIEDDLRDVRKLHDKKLAKLQELEKVRRDFKHSRFDDARSAFGNESLLASVLGQFLQGLVSGSDLWKVLQRNQRYRHHRSRPDFGSGSLGDLLGGSVLDQVGRHSSTWQWPQPRRGGGGFRLPRGGRSGRSSGGGFRTGGGF